MARILMTTELADEAGYNGIRDLASITATDVEIDGNPLFMAAENFIIKVLPDAADRTYANRAIVISALQFLTAAYLKRGGGSVGGETVTQGSGDVKSRTQTIGEITFTESFDVGAASSRSGSDSLGVADQADWLEEQAFALLEGLGAAVSDLDDGNYVLLTDSNLC